MTDTQKKVPSVAANEKPVRMYPANQLKAPVRKFSDTFRAVSLYEAKYLAKK